MVNYSNSKIYRIVPTNTEDEICYIGNTTKKYLSQRMVAHKTNYNKWKETGVSCNDDILNNIFDKYGFDNCKILLIENFPCDSKDELENKTNDYIKTLNILDNHLSLCKNKIVELESQKEQMINEEASDEFLINVFCQYDKYKHHETRIRNILRWNQNQSIDMDYYKSKWDKRMLYVCMDVRDIYAKPII
jgi:hypothetical protein